MAQGVSEVSVLSDGYGGEMDGVEALARQDDNSFEEDILAASDSDVIDPPNLGQSDREAIAAVEVRSHALVVAVFARCWYLPFSTVYHRRHNLSASGH